MADDDGWQFELEDLPDTDAEGDEGDGEAEHGGLTDPTEIPVEPETWTLEGAAFLVLGVATTLFVFLRFAVG